MLLAARNGAEHATQISPGAYLSISRWCEGLFFFFRLFLHHPLRLRTTYGFAQTPVFNQARVQLRLFILLRRTLRKKPLQKPGG